MWAGSKSIIQRAFAAGELAPSVQARADLALYNAAAASIKNFVVRRQGGVYNRSGFEYVATAKDSSGPVYLFPFIYPGDSVVVEAGDGYFRFHQGGAPLDVGTPDAYNGATAYTPGNVVSSGGTNYYCIAATTGNAPPNVTYWYALSGAILEIPTPYDTTDFSDEAPVQWEQSGLVVTITHPDYVPRELIFRPADSTWALSSVVTAPAIAAPTGLGSSGSVAGAGFNGYVVTAVMAETFEESLASSAVSLTVTIEPTPAAPITVTWSASSGAIEYRVYKDVCNNGVWGYIGTTPNLAFIDTGFAPDFFDAPPQARSLFASTSNYPATSTTYQQRRLFASTTNDREGVWASRTGFRSNFSVRRPLQDDDAITFRLSGKFGQVVRHLVGLDKLVMFTDAGIWLVYGDVDGALTPTRINLDQKGYIGAGAVKPVVIGDRIVYQQRSGARVRDLLYQREVSGYEGMGSRDLTLLAGHLFKGTTITSLAYAHEPDTVIWATRSDGVLLGCTYVPEDDAWGWHHHTTGVDEADVFTQVCSIPESNEDKVYVVVEREINGSTVAMIERLASRGYTEHEDAVHVDSAITYDGASATVMTGLGHLNGNDVYALTDGTTVQGPYEVSGGSITLDVACTIAQIGLPIVCELETLDLDANGTDIRGKRKRVAALQLLLEDSQRGFYVGPDGSHLFAHRAELWDTGTVVDGIEEINLTSAFRESGRVLIRHTRPTPLAINAVIPILEQGN